MAFWVVSTSSTCRLLCYSYASMEEAEDCSSSESVLLSLVWNLRISGDLVTRGEISLLILRGESFLTEVCYSMTE